MAEEMNKKVIYTCVTGGYDNLSQPQCIFDGFDYICFSDDFKEKRVGVWEIRPIPFKCKDKTRHSRFVKLNPHLALPEHDYSLWMDSNLCILTNELRHTMDALIERDVLMASVAHPEFDCIYDDAEKCIIGGRDTYWAIRRQVMFLKSQCYPCHNGLYENNLIFRKHNDALIRKISEEWWALYMQYSKRDQLSLCYVLWKNRFAPELLLPIGFSTRNSMCIGYTKHPKRSFIVRLRTKIKSLSNRLMNCILPVSSQKKAID